MQKCLATLKVGFSRRCLTSQDFPDFSLKSGHFAKPGGKRCADDTETANEHGSNSQRAAKIRSLRSIRAAISSVLLIRLNDVQKVS